MATNTKTTGQEAEQNIFLRLLNRMSLRTKIISVIVLVFLVLLVFSIPGDRTELLTRKERIEAAQVAYDLALPSVTAVMDSVVAFLDETEVDLSGNRSYTRLSSAITTFNRSTSTPASRFQGVVTFSENAHALLDGANAAEDLDTEEFRLLVSEMDTTFSVAWLALMELNTSVDNYNGYHRWVSAKITSRLFDLPQSYTDPVPLNSRLNRISLEQPQ